MFSFLISLALVAFGGIAGFIFYKKAGGVNALKRTLKTSYLALKTPQTKEQFLLHLAKILVAGFVLTVGTLLFFYLKFMFNNRVNKNDDEPSFGSLEHEARYPLYYSDEERY